MKKIIFFNIMVLLFACKTNLETKIDNKPGRELKGAWSVSSVTYPGSEVIKVKSFEVADSKCFVGSKWTFVPNNDTGEITLTQSSCSSFSTKITWFINKEGDLTMKFLNTDVKAKKVTTGYKLKVANQTETSFQLVDKINVGGNLTDVVYQFEKIN